MVPTAAVGGGIQTRQSYHLFLMSHKLETLRKNGTWEKWIWIAYFEL